MYDDYDKPPAKGPHRFGKLAILSIGLLTVIGMAGLATASAQESSDDKQIHATDVQIDAEVLVGVLGEHSCAEDDRHFVITQLDAEANAPEIINVTLESGVQVDVELDEVSGEVAVYTMVNLDSTVTNATAEIYAAWDGQFGLVDGLCAEIDVDLLGEHTCDDGERHFLITHVSDAALAPRSINVTFATGIQVEVELDEVSGNVAHYTTTLGLNLGITDATAEIYEGWDGEFKLDHGPCEGAACLELNVTAQDGPANELRWANVVLADEYKVYRATDGETFELLATVEAGTLSFEDTDVEDGQTYQYKVTVVVDGQESEACAHVEVTAIPVFSTTAAAAAAGILGIGGYALIQRRT